MCLNQLAQTKSKNTKIQAWDAGSSEFAPEDLYAWGADEVYLASGRVNDGQNRSLQFNHFIEHETDELLYCVDNDAFHDPRWNERLIELREKHKCIINLFNSYDHSVATKSPYYKMPKGSTISETDDVVFRQTCGGISLLLSRELIKENHRGGLTNGYDWKVPRWDNHVCTSKQSYVAHVNYDGMHTKLHRRNNVDLGLNPTAWLTEWLEKRGGKDDITLDTLTDTGKEKAL